MTDVTEFQGVYPILYSLFDSRGQLDREAMRRQVEGCIEYGADGIATLGLATEVQSLTSRERRLLVEWNAEDIGGRVPLAVTIFEPSAEEQVDAVRHAADAGASWVILQPPATVATPDDLKRAFSHVLDASPLPSAIQNAPQFLGLGLSPAEITELCHHHPQLKLIKQEVSAVETAELVQSVAGKLSVFTGRGGLELVDGLRAGVHGLIPAPEYADALIRIWKLHHDGSIEEAERVYRDVLPLAVFIMQSISSLTCYGKLLLCLRLGIAYHQRDPALIPTAFGIRTLLSHARHAGIPLPPDSGPDAMLNANGRGVRASDRDRDF
ncbi:MAG TPA: dihydrodipicolinate synthase family protein [Alphaproteobacteria bacterium]|nr:dihydrodipicolinate synthase family protein [Alphaproteobacteria bacterium]